MIKAAIFDIDGLLIDSEPLWEKTDRLLLKRRGVLFSHKLSQDLLLERLGTGHKITMEIYKKEFGITDNTNAMIEERIKIINALLNKHLNLMKGTKNLLKIFKKNKITMAAATGGHTTARLKKLLQRLNILEYFSVLVTTDNVQIGKPNPAIFLYAAKKLGIKPSDCLVLEDAPSGIEAGKRAGMYTFGINRLSIVRKKLEQSGADQVFASLKEILPEDLP